MEWRLTLSQRECVWPLIRLNSRDLASQRCFQATNWIIYRSDTRRQIQKCNRTWKTLLISQFSWFQIKLIAQGSSTSKSGAVQRVFPRKDHPKRMLAKWCEIRNDPCRHEEREGRRERRRKRVTQMEKTEQKKNEMLGSFILNVQKSPKCTIMLLLSSPSTRISFLSRGCWNIPKTCAMTHNAISILRSTAPQRWWATLAQMEKVYSYFCL